MQIWNTLLNTDRAQAKKWTMTITWLSLLLFCWCYCFGENVKFELICCYCNYCCCCLNALRFCCFSLLLFLKLSWRGKISGGLLWEWKMCLRDRIELGHRANLAVHERMHNVTFNNIIWLDFEAVIIGGFCSNVLQLWEAKCGWKEPMSMQSKSPKANTLKVSALQLLRS